MKVGPRPLAKLNYSSIGILCLVNFNEALQGNILWPFLPFGEGPQPKRSYSVRSRPTPHPPRRAAVKHWGTPSADVATYVGILASAFFVGQALSTPWWGAASDRFGRRPTLLIGLSGSCIGMLALGFAPNFVVAVLSRFLTGALNGNVAVRIASLLGREMEWWHRRSLGADFQDLHGRDHNP